MACQKKVWDQTQKVNYQGALAPGQPSAREIICCGKIYLQKLRTVISSSLYMEKPTIRNVYSWRDSELKTIGQGQAISRNHATLPNKALTLKIW